MNLNEVAYKTSLYIKKIFILEKMKGLPSIFIFISKLFALRQVDKLALFGYGSHPENISFELIYGWREKEYKKFGLDSQTLGQVLGDPSAAYYHGVDLPLNDYVIEFYNKCFNQRHKPQIVMVYTSSEKDGNFNSMDTSSLNDTDFSLFRSSEKYHFLTADRIDYTSFEHYRLLSLYGWDLIKTQVSESLLGWSDEQRKLVAENKHTLMTYVHMYFYSVINHYITGDSSKNIVEIGGGYGGLARIFTINKSFRFGQYKIIDLPFVGQLQEWFLNSESEDPSKYEIVNAMSCDLNYEFENAQLVIATHSLTELSPDLIVAYLNCFVGKVDYIYLSMQLEFHINKADLSWVLREVCRRYKMKHCDITEGLNVANVLFELRSLKS